MMKRGLAIAVLLAVSVPVHAEAQRMSSSIATPAVLRVVPPPADSYATRALTQRRDTVATDTARTNVAAWSALGGAILGGGYGYLLGQDCTGERNAGSCQRTATIGGAVVGAVIGYGLGSIVDMGIAHDRARARKREAARD